MLFANLLAWPLAYYGMKNWLDGFAYATDISVMSFLLAGILALVIAVVTISYQAIRAAMANPVHALKYE